MNIDWLILLLLTPVILGPTVFLAGFAGCGFEATPVDPPVPPVDPSDFMATANVAEHVRLTWKDNGSNTTHFRLRRNPDLGPTITIEDIPAKLGTLPIDNEYLDSLEIEPSMTYEYTLIAVAVDVESSGLVMAHVTTPEH